MSRPCFYLVALSVFVASSLHSWAEDSRTWQSLDGSSSVEATFIAYDAKTKSVELLTINDKTLRIDLSYLSKADQRFVKLVARKNRPAKTSLEKEATPKNLRPKKRSTRKSSQGKKGRLFGINWTLDMDNALKVAKGKSSTADDRPVMWLRVLGDLNGFM